MKDAMRTVTLSEQKEFGLKAIRDCKTGDEAREDKDFYLATNAFGDLVKMPNPFSTYRHMKKDGTLWVGSASKEVIRSAADRSAKSKASKDKKLW